jgi:hypothetical protein
MMTTSERDLDANWHQELQIDGDFLPDFDPSLHVETLKEVSQCGNLSARTVVDVVGYRQNRDNSFNRLIPDTAEAKWMENSTPYSVCGLSDLGQLATLNKMFQSLQRRWPPRSTDSKADALRFKQHESNRESQFAPADLGSAHPKDSGFIYGSPSSAFGNVQDIITKDVMEAELNELIAKVKATSFEGNLKKCAMTNPDNPLDLVISLLSVISADPHALANRLKPEANGGNHICALVMGLLTSYKSRDAIANGIKTEEDAQKVVEVCINFLNKIWLNWPPMRSFNARIGDQKHVPTYNQEFLKALAVSVTTMAEILIMLGQGDGIDHSIKKAAEPPLENLLDSFDETVLFRNAKK